MAKVDRALIRWAFNSLMSRGFSYSDEVWAMMPWVDYYNYALEANVHPSEPSRSAGGGFEFHVAPNATIREGEQLLLSYGTYTDFELSMWYGFTLCGGDGPHHHENCAYVVSPMADTDGETPDGAQWAVALAKAIGCSTLPPAWSPVARCDLGRCRFGRGGVTPHMRMLVEDIASANGAEPTDIARRIIAHELAPFGDSDGHGETRPSLDDALPLVRFARQVAADSAALLREVAAMDDEALEAWLERDVDI